MSKKPWRHPANPEYQSPALDTSIKDQPRPTAEGNVPDTKPCFEREGRRPGADTPVPPAQMGQPVDDGAWVPLSEMDAIEMLELGAHVLHKIQALAYEVIGRAEPKDLLELFQKPLEEELGYGTPQKRPRSGSSPLLTLMKIAVAATNQVTRILGITHPNPVKSRKAATLEGIVAQAQAMAKPGTA